MDIVESILKEEENIPYRLIGLFEPSKKKYFILRVVPKYFKKVSNVSKSLAIKILKNIILKYFKFK